MLRVKKRFSCNSTNAVCLATAKIVTSKALTLPLLNLKLGLETPLSPMKTDKETLSCYTF